MPGELVQALFCFIIAGLIAWKWDERFVFFWIRLAGALTFMLLGAIMLVPMEAIGVAEKTALIVVHIALFATAPLLLNVYQHWTNWAEIEAQTLASSGQHHAAIKLLRSVRAGREPTLLLLNLLAFNLHAIGRYEEALEVVEEAEQRFGLSHELTTKKAFCLARLGETESALALFTPMLEKLPNDFDLIFQYASLLLQMGMREDAEREYDRAEILFLREASEERKQEWRPKLDKMRDVLRDGIRR